LGDGVGAAAAKLQGGHLNTECLLYAFRGAKDANKRARIEELLAMHEEIKQVRLCTNAAIL